MTEPPRPLLALLALAVAAFPGTIVGQADSVLLGGPCLEEGPSNARYRELLDARSRARREAGADTAALIRRSIRFQKETVRLQCDNAWRWMKLAELYLDAGWPEDAVAVIAHVEPWAANEIERSADGHWKPLEGLWQTDAFRGSALNRRMERRREAHRARLEPFRAVLDTLGRRPPERYVAEGACPFECCAYRTWHALEETELLSTIGSVSVVATVGAGDTVQGLTGEVHVEPAPVAVVHRPKHDHRLRPGDVVFLLDYVGEGFYHVWRDGEVIQVAALPGVRPYCPIPAPECWGEHLDPEAARAEDAYVWWVKVETAAGMVGWTSEADHFGNMDACG